MSKIKKTTKASVTLEQAEQAAQQFAHANNRLATIEAAMNEAIEKVRNKHHAEITELKETLAQDGEVMQTLEAYAIGTKDTWEGRSYDLTHARLTFRYGTNKVEKSKGVTWEKALEFVMANKALAKDFVRTKSELDKKAILAADAKQLAKLEAAAGIVVTQDESFYVEMLQEVLTA